MGCDRKQNSSRIVIALLSLAISQGLTACIQATQASPSPSVTDSGRSEEAEAIRQTKQPKISTKAKTSAWQSASPIAHLQTAKTAKLNHISLSNNGTYAAAVEQSGAIQIWHTLGQSLSRTLPGHWSTELNTTLPITDIAFSPDDRYLITSASATTNTASTGAAHLIAWDYKTGKIAFSITLNNGCRSIAFSPDGKKLYGACDRGVSIWNLATGQLVQQFHHEAMGGQTVEAIAVSPDGQFIATADAETTASQSNSNRIRLWHLHQQQATEIQQFVGHDEAVYQLAFANQGKQLVSASFDGSIKVWDVVTGQEQRSIKHRTTAQRPARFAIAPDGQTLAAATPTSPLTNLLTGERLPIKQSHNQSRHRGLAYAFSDNNQKVKFRCQPGRGQQDWGGQDCFWRASLSAWHSGNRNQETTVGLNSIALH